ncbi:MAG TPA: RodZ domain-containing protein [Methylophilaceae bacterium]
MSEETPESLTEAEPPKPRLPLGATLRAARENIKLEVEDVAQQLRMSPHQVVALEQDRHTALPAPTFVRGFIRNYARLLQINAAPLLEAYQQMQPDSQLHSSISLKLESIPITNHAQKSFRLYLLTSFLLIVLGSGWWLYMEWSDKQVKAHSAHTAVVLPEAAGDKQPEANASPNSNPAPTPQSAAANTPAPTPAPTSVPSPAPIAAPVVQMQSFVAPAPPPAAPKPAVTAPVPVAAPPAPAAAPTADTTGPDSIRMTFSEITWVSVTDATGKQVFNKTKAADTEDTANGTAPFNIVVGNAAGMQMSYKGQSVDVASHANSNVARFTLP